MSESRFEISDSGSGVTITIPGDFYDQNLCNDLEKEVLKAKEEGKKSVIVDLRNVNIISAYGIKIFVRCDDALAQANVQFKLKSPQGVVKQIFDYLDMNKVFAIEG